MLYNAPIIKKDGDLPKRFITDDYFDLFVWYYPDGWVHGFQLCYEKDKHEMAATWSQDTGLQHSRVDTGEALPTANRTPMIIAGGDFPLAEIITEFDRRSVRLSPEIRHLVLFQLENSRRGSLLPIYTLLLSFTVGVVIMLALKSLAAKTHNRAQLSCSEA